MRNKTSGNNAAGDQKKVGSSVLDESRYVTFNEDEITYIDPKSDWGFKKLFGTVENKEFLINFLNSFFSVNGDVSPITDVTYIDKEQQGDSPDEKTILFDVRCVTDRGETFIVEMQRYTRPDLKERAIYYWMHGTGSMPRGHLVQDGRRIEYRLVPTYVIILLDYNIEDNYDAVNVYGITNLKHHNLLTEKMMLYFLELKKFPDSPAALTNMLEKWVYLLNNLTEMKEKPTVLEEQVFDSVITAARYSAMSPSERHQYDKIMMTEQDYINAMEYAKELAAAEGHKQGLEQGRSEGRTEGLEQGMEKGREQQLLVSLQKLQAAGVSEEMLLDVLSVTPEELAELRKKL